MNRSEVLLTSGETSLSPPLHPNKRLPAIKRNRSREREVPDELKGHTDMRVCAKMNMRRDGIWNPIRRLLLLDRNRDFV